MPLARDKILINDRVSRSHEASIHGNAKAVRQAYKAAKRQAKEIDKKDLLNEPEALAFKQRQEAMCATFHPAQIAYQRAQREHRDGVLKLAEDMGQWIDSQQSNP